MWIIRALSPPNDPNELRPERTWGQRLLAVGMLILGLAMALSQLPQISAALVALFNPGQFRAAALPVLSEIETIQAIALLWPPLLALAVWRSRSLLIDRAAALTLVIVGANETISLVMRWKAFGVRTVFEPPTRVVTLLELLVACSALFLAALACWLGFGSARKSDPSTARKAPGHREVAGRMTVLLSIVFSMIVLSGHASTFLADLLSRSQAAREFVLSIDSFAPSPPPSRRELPPGPERDAQLLLSKARELTNVNRFQQAKDTNDQAIEAFTRLVSQSQTTKLFAAQLALSLNNQAWLLSTCPDIAIREPSRAVQLAERAIGLEPLDGNIWNTLGVAQFRTGAWDASLASLDRAMELRKGGDPADWFFVAMIHVNRGDREKGGEWFDRAVQSVEKNRPFDEELYRFRAEAAKLLNRTVPPPPTISDQRQPFRPTRRAPVKAPKPGPGDENALPVQRSPD